jgi:hypothetical protein
MEVLKQINQAYIRLYDYGLVELRICVNLGAPAGVKRTGRGVDDPSLSSAEIRT